ncbi:M20 metallopeptidase family protein [Tamaricihabitans halophyticus]|nr:M20 family metallopeptidase [Tamaricihabitans halophyticus]
MNAADTASQPVVTEPATEARFTGLLGEAKALQPKTVALRRRLHKNPELGLQLPETQAAILAVLADLPIEVTTGDSTTSVVGVLRGSKPGPTVLLRADMDALPLTEETGVQFASQVDGVMHACGHDTHVAMLASAARVLSARRDALAGSVVFMFQPGEEGHHGARYMLDEGVLDAAGARVTDAFALHITSGAESGTLCFRSGPILASTDDFRVTVQGKGGHGSAPHRTVDPVPAAADMVGALQTALTRRVDAFDPAVLSVTKIAAGTTTNIIPETAELQGTIRTLNEETRAQLRAELTRICEHVAIAHGCTAQVNLTTGYPVTVNDPGATDRASRLATGLLGERHVEQMADPILGGEDFSYVLQEVPGTFAFIGACPPGVQPDDAAPNHSNRVCFDESALATGVSMYAAYALDTLR